MADESSTKKSAMKKGVKTFLWILLFIFLVILVYWIFFLRNISTKKVHALVAAEAAKYGDSASVEKVLLEGVRSIEESPRALDQARTYSKSSNIPIEQVLVDNSIAMAKNIGYIE